MSVSTEAPRRDSLYRRLSHTPLRDVFRGRLTSRLDIERVLDESGVPEAIREVVRRVAVRTRLTRFEKAEVARELASHFEDGLAAGAESSELVARFGDVATAAKLIRRAKKRARPLAVKTLWRAAQSCGAVLAFGLAVYVWFAVKLLVSEPNITRNYVAEYNAGIARIPEEDRGWPIYRAAVLATGDDWRSIENYRQERPGFAKWDDCAALAEKHSQAISLFRAAAGKPALGMFLNDAADEDLAGSPFHLAARDPDPNPVLWGVVIPHPTVLRAGSRLLRTDAYLAMIRRDADRAFADIRAILQMVEHASEPPSVIDDLVAAAILQVSVELVQHVLHHDPGLWSDDRLAELSHRLAGVRNGGPLRFRVDGERTLFRDFLQRCYTDDGDGDGILTARAREICVADGMAVHHLGVPDSVVGGSLVTPLLSAVVGGRRAVGKRFERHMRIVERESRLPLWELTESRADAEMEALYANRIQAVRFLPVAVLTPSLSRAGICMEFATQHRDATLVALALELHKRRSGSYPASLAELSPGLLPVIPLDRYDGTPIKYRLTDGRPLLYSVGVDRDDDGGRLPEGSDAVKANGAAREWRSPAEDTGDDPALDGDWILWPPVEEVANDESA